MHTYDDQFNVSNPTSAHTFTLLTEATHYVIIDTCSSTEMNGDKVLDTKKAAAQFSNI